MRRIICLTAFFLISAASYSQSLTPSVIASSGDHFSSAGVELSWTLGESVIQTFSGINSQLTQGFHQPFTTLTSTEEITQRSLSIFPNPGNGVINFQWKNTPEEQNFNAKIFSIEGRMILSSLVVNNKLDITAYPAGVYILQLEFDQQIFTFRLIKN